MIRINLLPQKRRAERAEGGQLWLGVLIVLFFAEVAGLFVWYGFKKEEVLTQERQNKELETRITQTKAAVKDHKEIQEKLATLRAREDAIAKLQRARTGPSAVLLELARILTPGRGPSITPEQLDEVRRARPLDLFNPNWDVRRVWITNFVENNRELKISGKARDGEDVAELARRMNLSAYFDEIRLMPGGSDDTGVAFELRAKVRY